MAFKWRLLIGVIAYVPVGLIGMTFGGLADLAINGEASEIMMAWCGGSVTFPLVYWVLWGTSTLKQPDGV